MKVLGFIPRRWELYEKAFVHRSASITLPDGSLINNERLEFLGDAILDAIVAEFLFCHYPRKDEGFLSKMRSKIVKRNQLNRIAYELKIDQLLVATSFNFNGGKHVCGNAFEALVGAIYLDKGYKTTKKFITNQIFNQIIDLKELEKVETDFKSRIIEWAQKKHNTIVFNCKEQPNLENPSQTIFIADVIIDGQILGTGDGFSKKEAEQHAAEKALEYIMNSAVIE